MVPICLCFSLPLLLTFTPFSATLQPCLLPSFPSADIRNCSCFFCKTRAGARSRESRAGSQALGPLLMALPGLSPHLRNLSTLPGTPYSFQPSCLLIPGFPIRAPGRVEGQSFRPGRAEGGLGPTLLQPWPGPAWPFQLHIYFSPLAFQPRRSREGEDVTSSAKHLSPGVPQSSPQAAPAQLPNALPTQEGCNDQPDDGGGMDLAFLRKE